MQTTTNTEAIPAFLDVALAWGKEFAQAAEWNDVSDRMSLILISPFSTDRLSEFDPTMLDVATYWLILDKNTLTWAPAEVGKELKNGHAVVQQYGPSAAYPNAPEAHVTILRDDAADKILNSIASDHRQALEARWHILRASAIHDPLRRFDQLNKMPHSVDEAELERVIRTLWVSAHASARGLHLNRDVESDSFSLTAGELAAQLLRLSFVLEETAYPTPPFLLQALETTHVGRRIGSWIQLLLSGDPVERSQAQRSTEATLKEVKTVLAISYRTKHWLNSPAAFPYRTRAQSGE